MIYILVIMAALTFGTIKLINYLFGWRKKFNYSRKKIEVWYNADLVQTFGFIEGCEESALQRADNWIEKNRERIEKYCK